MKGWKGWLLFTAICYLLFLVWTLPASLVWNFAAPRLGPAAARLSPTGLEGSWTDGRCASLRSGPLLVNDLHWTFRPLGLLAGRLTLNLTANLTGGEPLRATLAVSPGRLRLQNLRGQASAATLGEAFFPGLGLTGNLNVKGVGLLIDHGRLAAANGDLEWEKSGVAFPQKVTLGDLVLHLTTDNAKIVASLKDQKGPLQINCLANLKPDGKYDVTGDLQPRGQLTPELSSLVSLLGRPGAGGRVHLSRTGRLPNLF